MLFKILLWNHLVKFFCVLEVFWLLLQFRQLLLVCSGSLLLLHSVLIDYVFLEICPFHLGFQVSWRVGLCSNLLQSFVFHQYLPFHFWLCLFGSSFFFSWWICLKACQFCLKNKFLDLLILRIVLLVSVIYSALIFFIYFLLLSLGIDYCFSSSSCRCGVRLFI